MKAFKWLSTLLVASGWMRCVVVGWKIWVSPVRYLQYSSSEPEPRFVYRSFSEVSGLGVVPLVVPIVLVGLATWVAWRQRTLALGAITLMLGVFCFITGFSIGRAYVPIASVLLVATLVNLTGAVVTRHSQR